MNIVFIEAIAWEQLKQRLARLSVELSRLKTKQTSAQWLDSSDVCCMLDISKRTLQTYRNNGTIPFSMIGGKVYFKEEDVIKLLNRNLKRR